MKCCQLLRDFSVVMKLVAAVLDVLVVCLWGVWGEEAVPDYESAAGPVLFIHSIAGCLFVLPALLLAQILGETPGPWTQRVFLLMGLVSLLPLGGVGVYISLRKGSVVQVNVATLCFAVGLLMLADFVYVEKLYCWYKIDTEA